MSLARDARRYAAEYYRKLSLRERFGLFAVVAVIVFVLLYQAGAALAGVFDAQAKRLAEVERVRLALPHRLAEYAQLRARKEVFEKAHREVQVSRSDFEELLKSKDGVQGGFDIQSPAPTAFGANYEQLPFSLKFHITNYQQLLELLQEISQGKKPMIIKMLSINRIAGGRQLQVQLDLAAIRRRGQQQQES